MTPPDSPQQDPPDPVRERRGFLGLGRRAGVPRQVVKSLEAARRQVADLQSRHAKLEAALNAIRHDLAAASAERDQLRQRVTQIDGELGTEREGHAVAQLQLREARDHWADAERVATELRQALDASRAVGQQLEATAAQLQGQVQTLQAAHAELKQRHDGLEIAYAAERRDHEKFETLAAERATQLDRLSAEHAAMRAELDRNSAELQSESQARSYFESLAADKTVALDTMVGQHGALRTEHNALVTAHAAEQQARAHYEALTEEKSAALDALSSDHSALRSDHEALVAAHAEEQRQREMAEITAAAHASRIEALSGELAGVGTELDAMTAQHAAEQEARTQWEAHATELTATLAAEREQYQRTLEDERRTAEAARAEQAFQHREAVERLQAEHHATLTAAQQDLAQTQAHLESTTANLGAARADVQRLTEDLQAAQGEASAANLRAREESEHRQAAEQRRAELEDELDYVRSEVMGGEGDKGRKRGFMRRGGGRPSPLKAASDPVSRPLVQVPDETALPADESEVDQIIERRLFGDG